MTVIFRSAVAVAAGIGITALASSALAATPPPSPDDVAAVSQYFENIPTSSGDRVAGGSGSTAPLPPRVAAEIRSSGAEDADKLIELATSATHGAPQERLRSAAGPKEPQAGGAERGAAPPDRHPETDVPEPTPASAARSAGGLLLASPLAMLLLAVTAAFGVVALIGQHDAEARAKRR